MGGELAAVGAGTGWIRSQHSSLRLGIVEVAVTFVMERMQGDSRWVSGRSARDLGWMLRSKKWTQCQGLAQRRLFFESDAKTLEIGQRCRSAPVKNVERKRSEKKKIHRLCVCAIAPKVRLQESVCV